MTTHSSVTQGVMGHVAVSSVLVRVWQTISMVTGSDVVARVSSGNDFFHVYFSFVIRGAVHAVSWLLASHSASQLALIKFK